MSLEMFRDYQDVRLNGDRAAAETTISINFGGKPGGPGYWLCFNGGTDASNR
jgi:alkyl sulfatase BDS1-like metallo-beta-lactamase superfamily hydrolase